MVYCDSHSAIDLNRSTIYHFRTKNIDVRYQWLEEMVEDKATQLKKIGIGKNVLGMFTMVVSTQKLELCVNMVGMNSMWWSP